MNTIVILISADIEWKVVCNLLLPKNKQMSPFGEWFVEETKLKSEISKIIFFQGGWGKISAAASTQYIISLWKPELIINIGTCGGIKGKAERGQIILVEKTIVYDIIEKMGNPDEAIKAYTTKIDLSWLNDKYPDTLIKTHIVSGDRDLVPEEIKILSKKFDASVGDWESGAIAWVAKKNGSKVLILRTVSDLVGNDNGEAYDDIEVFEQSVEKVMNPAIEASQYFIDIFEGKKYDND